MNHEFNLEKCFAIYLDKVGLQEEQMHEIQLIETKRAFMAGCSYILLMNRDDFPLLDEETKLETLNDLLQQMTDFWLNEVNGGN